jgi:hypothetical protein
MHLTFITHPWLIVANGSGGTTAEGSGTLITAFLPVTRESSRGGTARTLSIQ